MKRFFFLISFLISFSIGQIWGAVESGTTYTTDPKTPSVPANWTVNSYANDANYTKLASNTNYIQTEEFCQNGFTSIKIKARKFGGPSAAQAVISVEWFENGGSSTVLATVSPTSTSLTDYTLSELESVTGNKSGYIKISCKEASGGKGCGVSQVTITYTAGSCGGGTPTCATPTFSPAAGSYEGTQNVTITSTTGATIYYTTDGSNPTTSGTKQTYSSPIAVSADMTIKAYATLANYDDSEVATAAYTITEGPDVTLDLIDGNWGFPTSNATGTETYTNSVTGYSVTCYAPTNYKVSGSSYFYLGKSGAYIELPSFSSPIEKIVVTGNSGASTGVIWNIFKGDDAVSTAATGCAESSYTFNIAPEEANVTYTLKVTSAHNLQIKAIKIFFGTAPDVATPTISGEQNFTTSTTVTLGCTTDGASIYYTTDGTTPSNTSTPYSAPFTLNSSATVKAIAIKGGTSSSVAEKAFTKIEALTTMDAIFTKATAVGTTATDVYITFNNWVVTGVKGSNAYVTDGTKGLIIYQSSHGFVVGNKLSGTAACKVQLYNGSSEITSLTSTTTGLTVTTGGTVTPVELDASGIAALTGVNTGSVIKISGACTTNNSKYYVAGVQLYNTLFTYENPTAGKNYNCTGVYVQYNSTKEILPRSAADIEEIAEEGAPEAPTFSPAAGTYTSVQSVEISSATQGATIYYTTDGTTPTSASTEYTAAVSVGETMTIKAIAIKNSIESTVATAAYTINLPEDESTQKTWNLAINETASASENELTWSATYVGMSYSKGTSTTNANNYYPGTSGQSYTSTRFYKNGVLTITPAEGKQITTVMFKATTSGYASALASSAWENASAAVNSADATIVDVTAIGQGAISATIGATCGFTQVLIKYTDADASVPANPTFSPAAGSYTSAQNVEISCTTQGATIYYTTDGTTPTSASTQYSSAISVSESMTIKAIAIKESKSSSVVSAAYTINIDSRKVAESPAEGFSSISGDLSGNEISFAANKGGAATDPNGSNTDHELRLYKYQATTDYGGYVTITAKEGCTIDQVVITVGGNCKVGYCKDAEDFPTKESTPISVGTSNPFDSGTGLNASSVNVINLDGSNQFKIKTITVYYTGEAVAPPTPSEDEISDYVLVTDLAQLQAGDKVIIVASGADKAAGSAASTYRSVVDIARTPDKSHLIFGESMPTEFTLGITNEGKYTFHDGNGYMYESGVKSVKVQADPASWTITIGEGNIATIQATNELRYNSGSPRFTTYESGQQTLQLYRKPGFEELRSNLEQGRLYSACMKQNIIGVQGGILWDISHYEGTKVYFEEIVVSPSTPLTAGRPFILMVTGDFKVSYSGAEIDELPEPFENSALRGTFSDMDQAAFNTVSWENNDSPIYMLVNNQLRQVADYTHTNLCTGNSLAANRAYLLYSALTEGQPNLAPGRRVMTMSVEENVATDINFSNGETINASKIIRNGQILILRDGKTFDVTGRELR